MSYFEGIELDRLFDDENDFAKNYVFDELTDELVSRAEETIGYKLPESYRELLRFRNGGSINPELDEVWLSAIYGISTDPKNFYGLESMFDNWRNEWEYPDIGIPFGETESAGHDMYYMDFRVTDEDGEPRIVRVDNEMGNDVHVVADNLPEFIKMILKNEPIKETRDDKELPASDAQSEEPDEEPVIKAPAKEKKSFFGKLFKG
ncbi:MAG: SMI1/KNR4 family protein [Bacillota bacterium]